MDHSFIPFYIILLVNPISAENLFSVVTCSSTDRVDSDEQKPFFQTRLHGIFHATPRQLNTKIFHSVYPLLVPSRKSEFVKLANIGEARSGLTMACGAI